MENVRCEPVYEYKGPNRDAVGMPILNRVFSGCKLRNLSEAELLQQENNKNACEGAEGRWSKESSLGCDCPTKLNSETDTLMPQLFISNKGCIFFKVVCENMNGGYVEQAGVPYCRIKDRLFNLGEMKKLNP